MAFLELNSVSKGYPGNAGISRVLNNINLEIEEGDFVAIVGYSGAGKTQLRSLVGASGAGKTTLISLMAGLIKPDFGTLSLNGEAVGGPGPDRGVVFQNYSL